MYNDELTKKLADIAKSVMEGKVKETEVQPADQDFVDLHSIDKEKRRGSEPLTEKDVEEANDFTKAAAKAAVAGKKEFEFDGETYPTEIDIDVAKKILGESVELDEAFIDIDATDPKSPKLAALLKKNNVKMKVIAKKGPSGYPLVKLTGKRKDLETVLKDPKDGWDDADLGEFIEESVELEEAKGSLIDQIKKIVSDSQAAKVGGKMIDLTTASAIAQVYDKVNDATKKKMDASKIDTLLKVAQLALKKTNESVELEEAKEPNWQFIVVDTSTDPFTVVGKAVDMEGSKRIIQNATLSPIEMPPHKVKNKSDLATIRTTKNQTVGKPIKEAKIDDYIAYLKKKYTNIKRMNPNSDDWKNLNKELSNLSDEDLQKVVDAKIMWASMIAEPILKYGKFAHLRHGGPSKR